MAALATPTWTEVQNMDELILIAMNIIKGEMNGDTFIWEHEEVDKDGSVHYGIWQSTLEKRQEENSGKITGSSTPGR